MGMSNAERQRKFRQNRDNNPTKREKYLKDEKERYQKNKQLGKRKCVATMTTREHRTAKKQWRNEKRKGAAKRKTTQEKIETPAKAPSAPAQTSRQKTQSLKKKNKEVAQCYRDNMSLKTQLDIQKRKAEMYRKRWVRALDKKTSDASISDTPRTKTKKLLRDCSKKYVRKTLIFHNAMLDQIKVNYAKTQKKGVKRTIASLLSGSVLKKYKVKTTAFQQCGIDVRNNLKKKNILSTRLCKPVREFYERDDMSRITTGIRKTITFKKIKKQRRILNDTLLNLHLKFLSETTMKVSYSTFCRLRPFWVVFPNESDRNTCLCKLCENTQFMCDALKKSTAIETDDINKIIERMVCDTKCKACMFSDCHKCKDKRMEINNEQQDDEVQWSEWTLRNEKRMVKVGKKTEEKTITITVKETKEGTICDLGDKFEEQVRRYQKHLFLIKNQYSYYRTKKQSLADNECMIHIDFSENYVCKMASEIQSMHFGASKKQISLHTGIFITKHQQQSFCTVSENINHGPAAIWAHLDPILELLKKEHPKADTIEFFSDGPTTQYRQKGNFHLASIKPQQYGFKNITWNFFESGHGKGIPDAIGGALKRSADQQIKYGKDIMTAKQFVNSMRKSETKCILITERNILDEQRKLEAVELKPIPGTMKLHQMMFLEKIYYRDISCTCKVDNVCTEHEMNFSEVRKDRSCSTKISNKSRKKTTKQPVKERAPIEKSDDDSICTAPAPSPASAPAPAPAASIATEETDFSKLIRDLKACKSFKKLTAKCKTIAKSLDRFKSVSTNVSIMTHGLEVDANAMDGYPNDVPDSRALYPCLVSADGNCLPSCGSIYAFGSPAHADEIRVRIVMELVCHEEWYLNADFLGKGTTLPGTNLPKIYAQYSDMYIPGVVLTENMIRSIYELEVMKIRQNKAYMGIWQIHALASILKVPIYSIYPKMGNPNVRFDLNRIVIPREPLPGTDETPVYILWTSNGHKDMTNEHWVPNHFVVVVPIDHSKRPNNVVDAQANDLEVSNEKDEGAELNEAVQVESQDTEIKQEGDQKQEVCEGHESMEMNWKEGENPKQEMGQGHESMDMDGKEGENPKQEVGQGHECMDMDGKEGEHSKQEVGQGHDCMDMDGKEGEHSKQEIGQGHECMDMDGKEGEHSKQEVGQGHECMDMDGKEGEYSKKEVGQGHECMDMDGKEGENSRQEVGQGHESMEMNRKEEDNQEINLSEKSEIGGKKDSCDQEKDPKGNDMMDDNENVRGKSDVNNEGAIISESKEKEWKNIPDPEKCVGLYVIVCYNNSAYPGLVVDAGQSDLYVQCIHRLGKKGINCFYWPKKLKDECWYDYDNVLAVIPELSKIESSYTHFKVDDEIWKSIQDEM